MPRKPPKADRSRLLLIAAVAAAVFAFAPAYRAPFITDDTLAIANNEAVVAGNTAAIFGSFSWWGSVRGDAPGYRPVVTSTYAWNWAAAGNNPAPYRAVNVALHAAVTLLVYAVGTALGLAAVEAALAALLFALLPIHGEAVIWIVGRAELMAAAGWAVGLLGLIGYRRSGNPAALAGSLVALLLGLFSKENAITLLAAPVTLAVLAPLPERTRKRDAYALAAMIALVSAYFVLRASVGPALPDRAPDPLDNPLAGLGPIGRIAGAFALLGRYLVLTFVPLGFTIDYSYNATGIADGFVGDGYTLVGVAATALGLGALVRLRAAQPGVAAAIVLAAAAYSIVSNSIVLIGTIMGERLFYLPTFGLCLAVAPLLARTITRNERLGYGVFAALAAVYLGCGWYRAAQWESPVTLFEAAVARTPESARAHMELGGAYGAVGNADAAMAAFARATEIKPDYAAAWYNLGNFHARRQSFAEAITAYETALEFAPKLVSAWFNLGMVYQSMRRSTDAVGAFAQAAEVGPGDPGVQMAYGDALLGLGRNREAVEAYTRALETGADPGVAAINRGVAKERLSGCGTAVEDYLLAAGPELRNGHAVRNAANCLERLGKASQAADLRRRAQVANRNTGR